MGKGVEITQSHPLSARDAIALRYLHDNPGSFVQSGFIGSLAEFSAGGAMTLRRLEQAGLIKPVEKYREHSDEDWHRRFDITLQGKETLQSVESNLESLRESHPSYYYDYMRYAARIAPPSTEHTGGGE